MQTVFKKATRHLDPADIVRAGFPPAGSFEPAVFLNDFFAALGAQVITEDYVGGPLRIVTVTGIRFVLLAGAVLSIFSVLKIAFGA